MKLLASFEVLGVPAPQGSKSAVVRGKHAVIIEGKTTGQRVKHKAWRSAVAQAAHDVAEDEPHTSPLQVTVTFRLPMPASRSALIKRAGIWPHVKSPDIDKLLRSTFDGLTDGGLIGDDKYIFAVESEAWEVAGWTGAEIAIYEWSVPS